MALASDIVGAILADLAVLGGVCKPGTSPTASLPAIGGSRRYAFYLPEITETPRASGVYGQPTIVDGVFRFGFVKSALDQSQDVPQNDVPADLSIFDTGGDLRRIFLSDCATRKKAISLTLGLVAHSWPGASNAQQMLGGEFTINVSYYDDITGVR